MNTVEIESGWLAPLAHYLKYVVELYSITEPEEIAEWEYSTGDTWTGPHAMPRLDGTTLHLGSEFVASDLAARCLADYGDVVFSDVLEKLEAKGLDYRTAQGRAMRNARYRKAEAAGSGLASAINRALGILPHTWEAWPKS